MINNAPCNGCWSILKIWLSVSLSLLSFFNHSCFLGLMCCGNDDAELWSFDLLESVIIPSGQSVWHSAVAFQSPPSSPLVRHSSLPPPLATADHSEQTCLYLCCSPLCLFSPLSLPPTNPKQSPNYGCLQEANTSTHETSQILFPCNICLPPNAARPCYFSSFFDAMQTRCDVALEQGNCLQSVSFFILFFMKFKVGHCHCQWKETAQQFQYVGQQCVIIQWRLLLYCQHPEQTKDVNK